jgi:antitoxin (DNA-binding transcriptional repressor) of toxin-antitoxin stability system
MYLTASKLRENIYAILDKVLETGTPVEIKRHGKILRIVPGTPQVKDKLQELEEHKDALLCDPEEIVHMDWSNEWKP